MPLSNSQMRDVQSVLHPYTNLMKLRETGPLILEARQGRAASMTSSGKDYIEAMAGLWCTALGWGENELADVAAEQMRKLSFGHLFGGKSHEPGIALAEKLKEISPFPGRQGVLRQFRLGSQRHPDQARLVRRQRARHSRRRRKSSRASRPITA